MGYLHSVNQEDKYNARFFFGKWEKRGVAETPANTGVPDKATFLHNHPFCLYFCYPQEFRFPTSSVWIRQYQTHLRHWTWPSKKVKQYKSQGCWTLSEYQMTILQPFPQIRKFLLLQFSEDKSWRNPVSPL